MLSVFFLTLTEILINSRKIYLDTNATTPLDPEVLQEITKVLKDHWANPSSCHPRGKFKKKWLLFQILVLNLTDIHFYLQFTHPFHFLKDFRQKQ